MAIRDCSGLPDDQVPAWVRQARERARAERRKICGTCSRHYPRRNELLGHLSLSGHVPLVKDDGDRFLKVIVSPFEPTHYES